MNLERLRSLFDDDPRLLEKFIDNVLRDMPTLLQRLQSAALAEDKPGFSQTAHDLKSLLHYFNASELSARAMAMEMRKFDEPELSSNEIEDFAEDVQTFLYSLKALRNEMA